MEETYCKCGYQINSVQNFCPNCGEKNTTTINLISKEYRNPFGVWKVATNFGEERERTRDLGTYKGFVDEIALYLANKNSHSLVFTRVPDDALIVGLPTKRNVVVQLADDYLTWKASSKDRVSLVASAYKDRPVKVSGASVHGSFTIEIKEA